MWVVLVFTFLSYKYRVCGSLFFCESIKGSKVHWVCDGPFAYLKIWPNIRNVFGAQSQRAIGQFPHIRDIGFARAADQWRHQNRCIEIIDENAQNEQKNVDALGWKACWWQVSRCKKLEQTALKKCIHNVHISWVIYIAGNTLRTRAELCWK